MTVGKLIIIREIKKTGKLKLNTNKTRMTLQNNGSYEGNEVAGFFVFSQ